MINSAGKAPEYLVMMNASYDTRNEGLVKTERIGVLCRPRAGRRREDNVSGSECESKVCKRTRPRRHRFIFASSSLVELSPRTKAACNKFRKHLDELRALKGQLQDSLPNTTEPIEIVLEENQQIKCWRQQHHKTYNHKEVEKEDNTIVVIEEIMIEEEEEEEILVDLNNDKVCVYKQYDEFFSSITSGDDDGVGGYTLSAVKDSCRSSITAGTFLEDYDEYSYYEEEVAEDEDGYTYFYEEEVTVDP